MFFKSKVKQKLKQSEHKTNFFLYPYYAIQCLLYCRNFVGPKLMLYIPRFSIFRK